MGLRDEQVALTRRTVVDAFVELSTRPGAGPVGIAEVSRHSGVSPATIYRHFPSRDALLHAAAGQDVHNGVSPDLAVWSTKDLQTHLAALWAVLADNLTIAREATISEAGRELRLARFSGFRAVLVRSLKEAGLNPDTRKARRASASIALLASAHTFLDLHDRQALTPEEAAETARWAIDAVLRAVGVDPATFRFLPVPDNCADKEDR